MSVELLLEKCLHLVNVMQKADFWIPYFFLIKKATK